MIRKIYIMLLILLFASSGAFAQPYTVKIHDVIKAPGNIEVPVDMLGYTNVNVGAITLHIDYNSDLMSFTGIASTAFSGNWHANATNGQIHITFTAPLGSDNNIDGKLLDLEFSYSGGFGAPLAFASGCEIGSLGLDLIPSTFNDGSVSQIPTLNMISLLSPGPVLVGTTATVPVEFDGPDFGVVNSVTLKIAYNPAQLAYVGYNSDLNFVASASSGMLTLNWINLTAINLNDVDLELEFVYNGGGDADLEFYPGCEIANDLDFIPVEYTDTFVTPLVDGPTITLVPAVGIPGFEVTVPVDAAGFGAIDVGGITLNIGYDPDQLTFTGFDPVNPLAGWVVNASGGEISIDWSNLNGVNLAGFLMDLNFIYNGGGIADLVFNPGTIISDLDAETIPVDFVNGDVTPDMSLPATLTIGMVSGTTAFPVTVPVDAEGFPDVGSVTIKVGFPADQLTYTGFDSPINGWVVDNTPTQVTFNWIGTPTSINNMDVGSLLELNFIYTGTGAAPVVFNPGVEITNPLGLVEMTLIDGGVNVEPAVVTYMVSGILKYANTAGPDRPITSSNVYLKTSDGLTTLDTATTDDNGYFEFLLVEPGDYILDASTDKPWGGVTLADYGVVRNFVNNGFPVLAGIYWNAADVNLSNSITLADYGIIRNYVNTGIKAAGWTQPDWIFEQVSINVSATDVTDIEVIGICSGDVNTSYFPPL